MRIISTKRGQARKKDNQENNPEKGENYDNDSDDGESRFSSDDGETEIVLSRRGGSIYDETIIKFADDLEKKARASSPISSKALRSAAERALNYLYSKSPVLIGPNSEWDGMIEEEFDEKAQESE